MPWSTPQKRNDFPFPLGNLSPFVDAFQKDTRRLYCLFLILYSNIEMCCLSLSDSD